MALRRFFLVVFVLVFVLVGFTLKAKAQGPDPTATPEDDGFVFHSGDLKANEPMWTVNKDVTPETTEKTPLTRHFIFFPVSRVDLTGCLEGSKGESWFWTDNPTFQIHLKDAGFISIRFQSDMDVPVVIAIRETGTDGALCRGPDADSKTIDPEKPITKAEFIVLGKLYADTGKTEMYEGDLDIWIIWRNTFSDQIIPISGTLTIQACSGGENCAKK